MSYIKDFLKEEMRKMCIPGIKADIILDFCRNLEHKDNFICSEIEHNGMRVYIIFYTMNQFEETLNRLANYIYKKGENN